MAVQKHYTREFLGHHKATKKGVNVQNLNIIQFEAIKFYQDVR